MATYSDVDAFFAKWNGKSVDRDGAFGAQCVDFAAQYTAELFGVGYLPTPVTGGARDIYERFSLGQYFDKIANTPTFVPTKGDIVIWTAFSNNQFGHIAIATGEGDTNWFNSYDQNWNAQRVEKVRHNYNSVLGVLRPKNLTAVQPQGDKLMTPDEERLAYNIVLGRQPEAGIKLGTRTAWGFIKDAEGELSNIRAGWAKAIGDRDSQIKSQQDQINTLNEKLKQGGLPQETIEQVKETNSIVKWIKDLLGKVFK